MQPDQSISSIAISVVDKVTAMIAYWDENLICRFANSAYLGWFGKNKNDMIDKMTIRELLGETLYKKNLPYILGALSGEKQTFEREIPDPAGTGNVRYALASYYPNLVHGQVKGFIVHIADVTTIKLLEKELIRSNRIIQEKIDELKSANDNLVALNEEFKAFNEELVITNEQLVAASIKNKLQANELKTLLENEKKLLEVRSNLISTISHEFRTPLTSILMGIEFIQKYNGKITDEQIRVKAQSIRKQVQYMNQLLDEVFTIGMYEANKVKANYQMLPVTIIQDLANEVMETGATAHVLNFKQETSIAYFHSDEMLLRQIIINVVTNAIKYSPGSKEIIITISASPDGKSLIISVRDTGIGIPPDEIKTLFTSFQRASNTQDIKGTGLGLSIVKRSLDLLKGTVTLQSELEKGTEVTISLPLSE